VNSTKAKAAKIPVQTANQRHGGDSSVVQASRTATGSRYAAVGFASSASTKSPVPSHRFRGNTSRVASESTSAELLLSCEIHATASTFAGWSRKSAPPRTDAASGIPVRAKSATSNTDASAWSTTLTAWWPKVSAPNACHATAWIRSCTGE